MILKGTVRLNLTDGATRALLRCDALFRQHGIEAVCTSANDSRHQRGSLHRNDGSGRPADAFDLRLASRCAAEQITMLPWIKNCTELDERMLETLELSLGDDYDVLLETHYRNVWNWHYHIEYQPTPAPVA